MKPRILPTARLSFALASAIAALLTTPAAQAVNLWWDTNGATTTAAAATGTWTAGSTANWTTVLAGNLATVAQTTTNADDLTFNATGMTTATITVSGTQFARSITFNTATTLSGGTAIDLGSATAGSGLFFGNQAVTISTPIILNSAATAIAITNGGGQTQTFGGTITGSAAGLQTITIGALGGQTNFNGIISNGLGGGAVAVTVNVPFTTTTLAAANTYTGATNILAGTLQVNNATTFTNTSAINLGSSGRLNVNAANSTLSKLATGGGGSGVVAGSFLRYSTAQTAAGAGNGPGTIFGTVELNNAAANPNYVLDFGSGSALTNIITATYTSPLTISGNASIDASPANATHTGTYSSGGITASTAGAKTLTITGTNTTANTISGNIGNGSGTIALNKGGGGTWVLSGTNIYTGDTRVDAGILQFTNQVSLYNNEGAATWTKTNINVADGATMAFNIGGVGQFTKANIITLLGLSDAASNGFMSGSSLGLDPAAGGFLYDSVIANTNSGANVLGLTKLGANTLTLDQDNTYTGRTVISAGTLQLGNSGTTGKLSTSSTILNNGNLTINRSDAVVQGTDFSSSPITGTGSFTQAGAGTTTLNTANTFSGLTTVSAGVLNLTNERALQNSAIVTTGAGTVTFTGFTTPVLGGLSGATGDLSTVIPGFASTTALSLNATAGSFTYGGIISDGAGSMSLTKNGGSTQILSGANTYTGATVVNAGTLTVGSGATGSLDSATTLQMGGGIFNYSRTGAGQTVNGLTVNAGNSTVNNTSAGQTLTLGAITRTASVYGSVNFATLTGAISTITGNTNSILGPWATTGSTTTLRYAIGSPDGSTPTSISALTGTTATANTLADVSDATVNYEYSAAVAAMPASTALTANTLRYHTGAATTTAINATSTLTLNGLMNAGTGLLTVSGGPSTGGIIIGSTNELVIAANAQGTTISSVIANGGSAGTLIYGGAGSTLTLSGANTYSGGLVINSGIVATGAAATGSVGGTGTGPITVNAAGRLTLNSGVGTLNRALTLNGGSLFFAGSGNDLTVAGTIVLGANSTIDATNNNSGFPTISADISGTGGFTKTNLGGVRLNGANTYSGPTVVSAGGVTVKSSLYGNDTTKWTPANITVAANATLTLNVSATEFTTAQAATMFSQLSTNVNNNGLLAGSFIGVDTRNATAGSTFTYSANITDSTGAGGGAVSFKHTGGNNGAGVGTTTLELTGANTYSGMSIVDNDGFLKVSSLNSVFTNAALGTVHSASSSLGAPTTVANGTIHLGTAGSTAQSAIGNTFRGGSLIYTGTGETTDRVISLNGGGGETYVLDQSGTGHLKFLSSFASIDTRATKTLTLRGSTAGTVELAGTIPNASNGNNQLTKSGTGTWTLSGANLYAGVTTVSGGALVLANANALFGGIGATGGRGALTFNGGVIGLGADNNTFSRPIAAANTIGAATFTGAGGWAAYGANRTVNLGGASAAIAWSTASTGLNSQTLILSSATATHTVDFQNPITVGGNRTVRVDNGAAAVDGIMSGAISGSFSQTMTKSGDGTLLISGTTDNGSLILNASAGVVILGKTVAGPHAVAGISNIATGATVQLSGTGGNQIFNGPFQTQFGLVNMSGGTLDLNGLNEGFDRLTGTGSVTNSVAATTSTLTLGTAGGSGSFGGVLTDGSGVLALTKTGAGTQTLNGTNLYTGATTVSTGTLSLGTTGSVATTTSLAIAAGASFDTSGQAIYAIPATTPVAFGINAAGSGSSGKIIAAELDLSNATVTYSISGTPDDPVYVLATYTTLTGGTFLSAPTPPAGYTLEYAYEGNKIAFVSAGTPYDAWATLKGLTGAPGFENGKADDPDGDGKNNLYEFAFDGNPLSGANDGKIVGKIATVGADQVLTLTMPVRAGATFSPSSGDQLSALVDVIYYRIEGDGVLSTFADTITEVTGGDATTIQTGLPALSGAGWTYRTFRAPGTVPVDPKAFLRAKVSETP